MRIVIAGAGEVGFHLAKMMSNEAQNIYIIDDNEDRLNYVQSHLDVFEKTLAHEQMVTERINDLYTLTVEEKDYPSQVLLQWFIEEQVEEEKNAGDILDMIKMVGDNGYALLMLDRELGQRQPPAEVEQA